MGSSRTASFHAGSSAVIRGLCHAIAPVASGGLSSYFSGTGLPGNFRTWGGTRRRGVPSAPGNLQATPPTGAGDPSSGPRDAPFSASCADLGPVADLVRTPAGLRIPTWARSCVKTPPRSPFHLQGDHFIGSMRGRQTNPSLSRLELDCRPRPASRSQTTTSSLFSTRLACCRGAFPTGKGMYFHTGIVAAVHVRSPLPRSESKLEQIHGLATVQTRVARGIPSASWGTAAVIGISDGKQICRPKARRPAARAGARKREIVRISEKMLLTTLLMRSID